MAGSEPFDPESESGWGDVTNCFVMQNFAKNCKTVVFSGIDACLNVEKNWQATTVQKQTSLKEPQRKQIVRKHGSAFQVAFSHRNLVNLTEFYYKTNFFSLKMPFFALSVQKDVLKLRVEANLQGRKKYLRAFRDNKTWQPWNKSSTKILCNLSSGLPPWIVNV